jgi:hypothetical protein
MTGTKLLERYTAGERDFSGANLHEADLRRANLHEADLHGANFDFSVFPMWCGSFNIICDKRLVAQLLYHLSRLDVRDCPEWDELRHDPRLVALANQSHVITKHNLPELGV